jgi:hypothetical protein
MAPTLPDLNTIEKRHDVVDSSLSEPNPPTPESEIAAEPDVQSTPSPRNLHGWKVRALYPMNTPFRK